MEFVNFKLYHSLGLKYPPTLDTKLEEVAAELAAAVSSLAGETESPQTGGQLENGAGRGEEETAEGPPEEEKLEELKEKLGVSVAAGADANGGVEEAGPSGGVEAEDDEGEDEEDDETKACRGLFKGLFFFLAREVGLRLSNTLWRVRKCLSVQVSRLGG